VTATPDTSSLAALRERFGPRHRWLFLATVMIGAMAAIMSSTIINVGVPDMSRHFSLGQERAQWVSSGFMVAMTVSMLTTPWLLGRFGYRRTYLGCMWLLMLGGLFGGLANQFELVLAMRVAEGLAAGVVQPIPVVIIMRAFEPNEQGRASGLFGMGVVLAPAIGPSVGGVLVDLFGWRSIFFMVIPFCVCAIGMAMRYMPTTAPGGVQAGNGNSLDWRGLCLAATGTLCLLNGLVSLHGGNYSQSGALLLAFGLCLAVFLWWERRCSEPLMDLRLFSHRPFAMGSVVAFIYGTALFGSTYLLPVFMQIGLSLSASYVGTILLPAGIVLAVTIPLVGRLADRVATNVLVSAGLAMLTASFALMVLVDVGTSMWLLVAFTVLGRMGLGFVLPSLNLGSLRGLDKGLIPQGSSSINFLRMLGGSAGVSLCGIFLQWRLAAVSEGGSRHPAFAQTFVLLALLCAVAMVAAWQLRAKERVEP
jgi:EmrB/QacA subfamily drug resistance transporter